MMINPFRPENAKNINFIEKREKALTHLIIAATIRPALGANLKTSAVIAVVRVVLQLVQLMSTPFRRLDPIPRTGASDN